ncbi:MAG: extracellular solute-binding protein [Bacteroidota bacterium]
MDRKYRIVSFVVIAAALICIPAGCRNNQQKEKDNEKVLTVFHAGSLAVPMKNLAKAFEEENPGVKVRLEAAGSLDCIRKITELNQVCDILALADCSLIDEMLIPEYATWNIRFASNELCLVYTDRSRMAGELTAANWFTILMNPGVRYGRSDPDSDPCGYRTILALQLADRCTPGGLDWKQLIQKDTRFIRGKETDLNALLESRTIDYMFNYRSVAIQHGFKFLSFPDSINLKNPALESWYSGVSVEVRGTKPGSYVTKRGSAMIYGITVPTHASHPELAQKFIDFLVDPDRGRSIIEASGQTVIQPAFTDKSRAIGTLL